MASNLLKQSDWSLEVAANEYYRNPALQTKAKAGSDGFDPRSLTQMFDNYRDAEEDAILVEGTERYCRDLQVDPMDVVVLALAFHLNAKKMCEFKREDFVSGWTKMRCDTLEKQKHKLHAFRSEFNDNKMFHEIYAFAFGFGLSEGQKSLPIEVAMGLWDLLLPKKFPLLQDWLQFVQSKGVKGVSRDTWNLLLDFAETVNADLSSYDEDGAWPILMDEVFIFANFSLFVI